MKDLVTILAIGIALSMDAFSLSLSAGTQNIEKRKRILIPIFVGIFHFFMPLLGNFLGDLVVNKLIHNFNFTIGIILIVLAIDCFIKSFKYEKPFFIINYIGVTLFAFSVSIDSFSVGIGLNAISLNHLFCYITFSTCSFLFTNLGLIVGKYINKQNDFIAKLIGALILLIVGITFLCK